VGSDLRTSQSSRSPPGFQSTLPVWGATLYQNHHHQIQEDFNPRSPCGERPVLQDTDINLASISIHAPRVGSDAMNSKTKSAIQAFQSTLPVWGATKYDIMYDVRGRHFNPRSPCGERPTESIKKYTGGCISIHAPRVGSDSRRSTSSSSVCFISIHAPRVGSDLPRAPHQRMHLYFNPRSPCGERQWADGRIFTNTAFQSTLPVWGATYTRRYHQRHTCVFQSTLPVWGATGQIPAHRQLRLEISIHAPRVGSDGGDGQSHSARARFQSTLPVWGATDNHYPAIYIMYISIHAPRVGSDSTVHNLLTIVRKSFQSTLPVWGATGYASD